MVVLITQLLFKRLTLQRLGDYTCFCEPICYFGDFDLKLVSNFSIFDKNYKTLYSSNSISFSTDFYNVYFILLTYFDWFWTGRTSVEASTTTTITPASTVTHLYTLL